MAEQKKDQHTMKAAYVNAYGGLDQLKFGDVPIPEPTNNQLLIKVHAASINPIDWKVTEGLFKAFINKSFPFILGWDASGVVAKVGADVKGFKVGDEVFFANGNNPGTFAEYTIASEAQIAPKPKKISHEEAASLGVVGFTAYEALKAAKLGQGQKILVYGGSGGVGSIGIQLAKALGATVATTCSSANIEFVKQLGADVVIDYKQQKVEDVLKDYDAVFDTVGAQGNYQAGTAILKKDGLYVAIAGAPQKANNFVFVATSGSNAGAGLAELGKLVDAGQLKPIIDKVFDFNLEQVTALIEASKSARAKGKLVVKIAH